MNALSDASVARGSVASSAVAGAAVAGAPITAARAAWRGIITEYRDRLPTVAGMTPVTLHEGGTPLLPAPVLSARTGCQIGRAHV